MSGNELRKQPLASSTSTRFIDCHENKAQSISWNLGWSLAMVRLWPQSPSIYGLTLNMEAYIVPMYFSWSWQVCGLDSLDSSLTWHGRQLQKCLGPRRHSPKKRFKCQTINLALSKQLRAWGKTVPWSPRSVGICRVTRMLGFPGTYIRRPWRTNRTKQARMTQPITFVGYLMSNPLYTNNLFYFNQFSLARVHSLSKTFLFQAIQFSQTVPIQI